MDEEGKVEDEVWAAEQVGLWLSYLYRRGTGMWVPPLPCCECDSHLFLYDGH